METTSNITPRKRFDWLLIAVAIAAVSLLIAATIPLGCAARLMNSYHGFVEDLGDSLLYARKQGTLEFAVNGEPLPAQIDQAEWLYQHIFDAGMGSPIDEVPTGENSESLSYAFGDGSSLRLSPTVIEQSDGTCTDGAIVCYTRSDGSTFAYDTDQFSYREVLSVILGDAE